MRTLRILFTLLFCLAVSTPSFAVLQPEIRGLDRAVSIKTSDDSVIAYDVSWIVVSNDSLVNYGDGRVGLDTGGGGGASTDTLDTVTDRGASTTNILQVGGLGATSVTGATVSGNTLRTGSYAFSIKDGAAGEVQKTDGSGVLTWAADNTGGGGSDNNWKWDGVGIVPVTGNTVVMAGSFGASRVTGNVVSGNLVQGASIFGDIVTASTVSGNTISSSTVIVADTLDVTWLNSNASFFKYTEIDNASDGYSYYIWRHAAEGDGTLLQYLDNTNRVVNESSGNYILRARGGGTLSLNSYDSGDISCLEFVDIADASDGKSFYVHRNATTESDTYLRMYIDQYLNAYLMTNTAIAGDLILNCKSGSELRSPQNFSIGRLQGGNKILYHYGTITAAGADKYVAFKVEDADDYYHLTRQDAYIKGFRVEMPFDAQSVSATTVSGNLVMGGHIFGDYVSGSTVSGNIVQGTTITATNAVSGPNVTSGIDPGHTHSTYLTSESDTLNTVVGRGASTTYTLQAGNLGVTNLISGNTISGNTIRGNTITGNTVSGNLVRTGSYTFPVGDGTAGYTLKTDGAGVISFAADNTGGGGTDNNWKWHSASSAIVPVTGNTVVMAGSFGASRITGDTVSGNVISGGHLFGDYVSGSTVSGNVVSGSTVLVEGVKLVSSSTIQFTVTSPGSLVLPTVPIWSNEIGTFKVQEIKGWCDNAVYNVKLGRKTLTGANDGWQSDFTLGTAGTGCFYGSTTTPSISTVTSATVLYLSAMTNVSPTSVKLTIRGIWL